MDTLFFVKIALHVILIILSLILVYRNEQRKIYATVALLNAISAVLSIYTVTNGN